MARYPYEKYTGVWWATTVASTSAPTVAEIGAGTPLHTFLLKDGLQTPQDQNMIDNASLAENFDAQNVGSWGGNITLRCFRDQGADTAYDLMVYGTHGFIIIRRGLLVSTAVAADQKVEVWPAQMHQPVTQPSARNENTRFQQVFAVTAEPVLAATVAAGGGG